MIVGTPSRNRRQKRIRLLLASVLAVVVVALGLAGFSITIALRQPTGDDTSVKLAEWARDHDLGIVVTAVENIQYRLNPPATGGAPDTNVLNGIASVHQRVALHASLATTVRPALAGEGKFIAVGGAKRHGDLQITYMRPDTVHTSYLTGIAWMSHKDRFVLHPGNQDPGNLSQWSQPDHISATARPSLLATFNGGFKLKDATGGYYDHGKQAGQLVNGAASLVIYNDGHATVGTWGVDVKLTSDVAYVRQNLQPLIANGVIASNLDAHVQSTWGATVGGSMAVWRSGLGVTSAGDLVYVMGDALSVTALADLLHRAGAVNAMQLDINRAWISFMYYRDHGGTLTPRKMGTFQRPANRYFQPTSRDFIAVYAPKGQ